MSNNAIITCRKKLKESINGELISSMELKEVIKCKCNYSPVVNFAMQQNHVPIVRNLCLTNSSEKNISGLKVSITAEPGFAIPFEMNLEVLPAGETIDLGVINFQLSPSYLSGLTERMAGSLFIKVLKDEKIFCEEVFSIDVLAFDEWSGLGILPEIVGAFVTPNHPEVMKVLKEASVILGKWSGNPSFDAYQTNDPNRVRLQAAAIYAALQAINITYCVAPASFEDIGQRVRLADNLLENRMGNCLDLTVLYAGCLEAVGLNPLVIFTEGHAFVGLWLINETFSESIQDDVSLITKRIALGIQDLCIIESTAVTTGKNISFEEAIKLAEANLIDIDKFYCFVDIKRARASQVRPLPMRVLTNKGWEISKTEELKREHTDAPEEIEIFTKPVEVKAVPITKQKQWERRLLDLSLRNSLLNFRMTRSSVPILATELSDLEDALAYGEDFEILQRPSDWEHTPRAAELYENTINNNPLRELLKEEFHHKRLRADLDNRELLERITKLYRSARIAMEENGASTLYLALGMLKWYESDISRAPRFAPIVLIPIEIIRKSVKSGFIIRARDEEPQINITLLEMLRQDFGISIGGMDPLPKDESGIDLKRIFADFRYIIMNKSRWDVVEGACLGLFSFSQFVMWNDIRNRAEELAKNKVVASLLEGKLTWVPEDSFSEELNLDEKYDPKDLFLPISADSSQKLAIASSSEGKSFVLHGPPGTGKSQTITNIIANALGTGKRVLFVAEKMAALTVVQKRLEGIGLEPFCLELHSNKSTKKAVLNQLKKAMEVGRVKSLEEWNIEAEKLAKTREELNIYVTALHEKQGFGLSLYEVLTRYGEVKNSPEVVIFKKEEIRELTKENFSEWIELAKEISIAGKECGHPYENPWQDSNCMEYSKTLKTQAANILNNYKEKLEQYNNTFLKVLDILQIELGSKTSNEIDLVFNICEQFLDMPEISVELLKGDNLEDNISKIEVIARHGEMRDQLRDNVLLRYRETILNFNGELALSEWQKLNMQWFLPKLLGQNRIIKTMKSMANSNININKETIENDLQSLIKYREEEKIVRNSEEFASKFLGRLWCDGEAKWKEVSQSCKWILEINKLTVLLYKDSLKAKDLRGKFASIISDGRSLFLEKNTDYLQKHIKLKKDIDNIEGELSQLLSIDYEEMKNKAREKAWFEFIFYKINLWKNNMDNLRNWCTWLRVHKKAEEAGLSPLLNPYKEGKLKGEEVTPAFEQGIYKACSEYVISKSPSLKEFSSSLFEEKINKFNIISERFEELTREEIYVRLVSKVPNFTKEAAQSSEAGILQRAIRSNGRGISIRKLIDGIPNLLPRLCPCMLMSPISVAQYLDPKNPPFDIVIFDEASQIPTCEAIGAMARGKEVIVVGDPNQMPPTSFFTTNRSEEDEEAIATEDLESILDDCLAIGLPQEHLLWHYRSKHESLITFSNVEYYENNLLTFPSPKDLVSSVTLCSVDGFYDRGKTRQNHAEAEAVVNEIINRLSDHKLRERSIGVVTFSSVQQTLIEDLLDEAFKKNPEIENIALQLSEPIFIKNLENVQGDERDVILFSVGYGPDINGKVSLNFGPLNREGGWRRLNVAVSRARYEMKVFSTLRHEQIDVTCSNAQGVMGLKAFLEYAEKGKEILSLRKGSKTFIKKAGIENQIAKELEDLGYKVKLHVGSSGYKIDLGVVDPKEPGKYILGIVCDGHAYASSKTAKDREILRNSVLKQLGWNIHRVWSLDWFEDSKSQVEKILLRIKECSESNTVENKLLKNTVERAIPFKRIESIIEIEPKEELEEESIEYKVADLECISSNSEEFYLRENFTKISEQILKVIEVEGPISRPLLCKRVLQAWGISRMGARIDRYFEDIFKTMSLCSTCYNGVNFYWPQGLNSEEYNIFRVSKNEKDRRNPEDLPPEEVASCVKEVLLNQISLSKDDLIKETYKKMGYQRIGSAVKLAMENGIYIAIKRGFAYVDEEERIVYRE
ncbi:DUF3320 domain-containing protein [Hathewaya massiliensis]|uniref:DUF3320 domain-containing protein n=1 Tax=Hathewaya massiliensis TaxID=1964382 RepID=UPI00163C2915|nr:DUF3320 domain-containing protein [Hathewaya massiliensis]